MSTSPHIGKKCIIRAYASGVHFGTLVSQNGRQVELIDSRRLWRWHTGGHGISLSEVAVTGIDPEMSRIAVTLPEITILDALEIIPVTDEAAASIESAEAAATSASRNWQAATHLKRWPKDSRTWIARTKTG